MITEIRNNVRINISIFLELKYLKNKDNNKKKNPNVLINVNICRIISMRQKRYEEATDIDRMVGPKLQGHFFYDIWFTFGVVEICL